MSIYWTPINQTRSMPANGQNSAFVYLVDELGDPITGVQFEDLADLRALGFEQGSAFNEQQWLAVGADVMWQPLGNAYPGLYRVSFPSAPFSQLGCKQVIISLTLISDPERIYLTSVEVQNGTGGGGDGGGDGFVPSVFFGLLGYNSVYSYTAHDSGGRPLLGAMTIYRNRQDAASEANPLGTVDLQYEYAAGRLVKVKKLVDPSSFQDGGEEE